MLEAVPTNHALPVYLHSRLRVAILLIKERHLGIWDLLEPFVRSLILGGSPNDKNHPKIPPSTY
jgi:hypothetical protein